MQKILKVIITIALFIISLLVQLFIFNNKFFNRIYKILYYT